jgi:hypothetical protein
MKIVSTERKTLWWAWGAAIFVNAVFNLPCVWSFLSAWHTGRLQPNQFGAVFFVAFSLAVLAWAIRETVLWENFGETYFLSDMDRILPGSQLQGRVAFSRARPASMGRQFRLRLSCVVNPRGGGKEGGSEVTIWSDSHLVDLAPDGTIPILFSLPTEVKRPFLNFDSGTIWRLKIKELGRGF